MDLGSGPISTDGKIKPNADGAPVYRVLARKYRPQTFAQLIGQEPMVRTLANAFSTGRIAQAWMLTGVRGVGKTTTARILARALNYQTDDAPNGGPSVEMPEPGIHCHDIMEGRHVDVLEMDAASHTSINDIREITDSSRYKPVSSRYKVYIIDEVHMLSTSAFNGLLKTLEEPPEHVKFIFATTEIRKVPVTVLSRCQRFDLRRIEITPLVEHLKTIAELESAQIGDEALRMIAQAAEGSVRDALSLLDQAIAHAAGEIDAETVRSMLGLADRARTIELFDAIIRGDPAAAFAELARQYDIGANPATVLSDLANFVHLVTRMKHVPQTAEDPGLAQVERDRAHDYAQRLSVRVLSRAWQMLLKGIGEVNFAPKPLPAAEMVLVRLCYAADLPTPDEVLRGLVSDQRGESSTATPADVSRPTSVSPAGPPQTGGSSGSAGPAMLAVKTDPPERQPAVQRHPDPGPELNSLADIAGLAGERRDLALRYAIENHLRPVTVEPGRLEIVLTEAASPDLAGELGRKLTHWTGTRWIVSVARGAETPTLAEIADERNSAATAQVREDPLVAAAMEIFPGSQIVKISEPSAEPEIPPAGSPDNDT